MPKKILYVILDEHLPIGTEKTPNLDSVMQRGRSGLVTAGGDVFSLLGYDSSLLASGLGPVEALGAGIELESGDVAWCADFATVDDAGVVIDESAGGDLSSDEARALADALNANVSLAYGEGRFVATGGSRGVLMLRGDVPPAELEQEWLDAAKRVLETHEVNVSRAKRDELPANTVLLHDAGEHLPLLTPLPERLGMRTACFVQRAAEIGVARLAGMDPIVFSAPVGAEAYSDLADRVLAELEDVDAAFISIEGDDRDALIALDEGFFGTLLRGVTRNMVLGVTAPPVLVVYTGSVSSDGRQVFAEAEAADGALGPLNGVDVLPMLVSLARA